MTSFVLKRMNSLQTFPRIIHVSIKQPNEFMEIGTKGEKIASKQMS